VINGTKNKFSNLFKYQSISFVLKHLLFNLNSNFSSRLKWLPCTAEVYIFKSLWSDFRSSGKGYKNNTEDGSVKTESGLKLPKKYSEFDSCYSA